MKKRQSLRQVVPGKLDSYMEKNEHFHFVIYKLKWVQNLNAKSNTVKLLEENVGQTLFDKRGKIHNEEKTISLTSGAGKTGQPHVTKLN